MSHEARAFLLAAGLVVVAICGLVVIWKITRSLVTLLFWVTALLILAVGAWWLLGEFGVISPLTLPV